MPHASTLRKQPGGKWEIEFTAGVWTDVTTDVDQRAQVPSMRFGRSSEFSQPQPAELTVTLRNFDRDATGAPLFDANRNYIRGNYTPNDPTSPYYPNIQPRKRIRYSYNPGVQRFRFTGYIKSWAPVLADGARPYMQITAADRLDQLSRVTMLSPIRQEITADAPALWWPLTDAAGSTKALEQSGNSGPPLGVTGTGTAVVFGDNGPGAGDGTGVKFAAGQYLDTRPPPQSPVTWEVWANTTAVTDGSVLSLFDTLAGNFNFTIVIKGATNAGKPTLSSGFTGDITGTAAVNDGGWHHFAVTWPIGPSTTMTFYVDGVSVGTATVTHGASNFPDLIRVGLGGGGFGTNAFTGNIGEVGVYYGPLSAARVLAHSAAGNGYFGDTTDQRIARYLGRAGLTASDWTLDGGQTTVGTYPQDGKDVLSACQDMATTEGGGAVVYVTPDGKVTFRNRRYRDNRTPKLTIDAVNDLDGSVYAPSFDDLTLVTSSTVNRSSESGTDTTQTYAVTSTFGVFADQLTTYTTSDADAVSLAQYDVNSRSTPALRFPQIAVNLATSFNNLYDQVGQLQIGDRIRLQNIPAVAYPTSTVDFFLEGWQETPDVDSYMWVADITPADIPAARALWDVSVWDGGDVWTQ
jgi:hypothetical protein